MIDWDKWQEILSSLGKQKLRTGLTAFGVFWGIFMLVILLGFGSGYGYKVEAAFGDAKNMVVFWAQNATQLPYQGLGKGRRVTLTQEDVDALRQKVSDIDIVDGSNSLGGWGVQQYVVHGNNSGSFPVTGSHEGWQPIEFLKVMEGRYINKMDEQEERKVAVIGMRVRDMLFKDGSNPIGKSISINGVFFVVVGIYKSTQQDNSYQNTSIFVPNQTLQRAFNQRDSFTFIIFQPKDGRSGFDVEKQALKILYERKKIHPDDKGVIGSFNMEKEYQDNKNLVGGILGFSWMVAIGTIIAGVIGVGNIMLVIVKERTREIGLRKALGATPAKISLMIMHESLVITLVAGYSGLVAGVLLLEGIKAILVKMGQGEGMFASPFIDIGIALMALVVLVVAGLVASLLPALKAASVNPITALQDE